MTVWLAEMLVSTTVLMAIVLLLRRPVAQLFGAQAAYALWLAPFLRLVVPPLPDKVAESTIVIRYDVANVATAAAPVSTGLGLVDLLLFGWVGGALLFLLHQCLVHHRFIKKAREGGRSLGTDRGVELIESAGVEGPIAVGIFRRQIILPVDFARRVTAEQRDLALAHEQLHHRRHDLLALAGATAVLAIHWFNPLAHAAYRAFRGDLESACDAQLARNLTGNQRAAYAEALVRCAAAPVPRVICTLTTIGELKGRLKMLKFNHGRIARSCGSALALSLTAGGIVVTAQAQASPQSQPLLAVPVPGKAPAGRVTALTFVPVESVAPQRPGPPTSHAASKGGAAHAQPSRPVAAQTTKVTHFAFRDGAFHADRGKPPAATIDAVTEKSRGTALPTRNPSVSVNVYNCSGKQFQTSAGGASDSSQATFHICADSGKSDSEFAALLEQSVKRIENSEELNGPHKPQILAQLRAKIAELRSK